MDGGRKHVLLVQDICDPENAFSLLELNGVQSETGSTLVETDAVGKANSRRDEEESRLRIRCSLEEKSLGSMVSLDMPSA
jgi:hypothetical protein